jgi:hypothetical protein
MELSKSIKENHMEVEINSRKIKLKIELPCDPIIPFLGMYPK